MATDHQGVWPAGLQTEPHRLRRSRVPLRRPPHVADGAAQRGRCHEAPSMPRHRPGMAEANPFQPAMGAVRLPPGSRLPLSPLRRRAHLHSNLYSVVAFSPLVEERPLQSSGDHRSRPPSEAAALCQLGSGTPQDSSEIAQRDSQRRQPCPTPRVSSLSRRRSAGSACPLVYPGQRCCSSASAKHHTLRL
jgi:hypothetical protein